MGFRWRGTKHTCRYRYLQLYRSGGGAEHHFYFWRVSIRCIFVSLSWLSSRKFLLLMLTFILVTIAFITNTDKPNPNPNPYPILHKKPNDNPFTSPLSSNILLPQQLPSEQMSKYFCLHTKYTNDFNYGMMLYTAHIWNYLYSLDWRVWYYINKLSTLTHTYTHAHTHTHSRPHTHTRPRTHTPASTHTHTHTRPRTHTYMCANLGTFYFLAPKWGRVCRVFNTRNCDFNPLTGDHFGHNTHKPWL